MDKFNADWLAQYKEDIIEPELRICDAHHHLWDFPSYRYMPEELLADIASGHNVVSTVYMECMWAYDFEAAEHLRSVGESRFVKGVQEQHQESKTEIGKCMVGSVYLDKDGVAEALDAHLAVNNRFRGIRHATGWHSDENIPATHMGAGEGLLSDKQFRRGFSELVKRNLSFDAWLYHTNIDELSELADIFPDTRIVLDHTGGPLGVGPYEGRREEVFAEWKKAISLLSERENVFVKIGGLNMQLNGFAWETKNMPPSSEELAAATAPFYLHCIEAFGVERCMWQSNFPVDKVSCSYDVLWNSFKRITSEFSADEKAWLYHDTAARVYRFGDI
jgi:predicted TIM-barrel fold metal-dependent hydrolase